MMVTLVVLFSACTITALAHIAAVLTSAARRWRSTGSTRAVSYVDQTLLPWGEIGIALLVFAAATIGAASATGTIVELDVLTAALVAFSTTVAGAAVVHRLAAWPAARRVVIMARVLALVVLPAVIGILFGYVGPDVDQAHNPTRFQGDGIERHSRAALLAGRQDFAAERKAVDVVGALRNSAHGLVAPRRSRRCASRSIRQRPSRTLCGRAVFLE
jgi:hypothetical protein